MNSCAPPPAPPTPARTRRRAHAPSPRPHQVRAPEFWPLTVSTVAFILILRLAPTWMRFKQEESRTKVGRLLVAFSCLATLSIVLTGVLDRQPGAKFLDSTGFTLHAVVLMFATSNLHFAGIYAWHRYGMLAPVVVEQARAAWAQRSMTELDQPNESLIMVIALLLGDLFGHTAMHLQGEAVRSEARATLASRAVIERLEREKERLSYERSFAEKGRQVLESRLMYAAEREHEREREHAKELQEAAAAAAVATAAACDSLMARRERQHGLQQQQQGGAAGEWRGLSSGPSSCAGLSHSAVAAAPAALPCASWPPSTAGSAAPSFSQPPPPEAEAAAWAASGLRRRASGGGGAGGGAAGGPGGAWVAAASLGDCDESGSSSQEGDRADREVAMISHGADFY